MLGRSRRCSPRRFVSPTAVVSLFALCMLAEAGVARTAPKIPELRVRTLTESYREVFATLAHGDRSTAIERAATFETQALAASPQRALARLSQADRVLVDELVHADPKCALPLAIFYQRLVLAHAAQELYGLSQRALRVAERLYAQMSLAARTADERRLTATAYTGFAADLLIVPAPSRAAEMLSRGLLLLPDDVDANLALSILSLRLGRPAEAAELLDRVLGAHPENREARLRRALMRTGFSAEGQAADERETLATAQETDWIALVGAQENARRLLASGNYDNAISFLKRVLARFPSDSSLRVALAFAAARSGRRAEARSAVETALAAKAAPEESARRRFGELPIRLLRPQAALAEAAADRRAADLAAALSSTARPSPPATVAPPAGKSR